MGRNGWALAVAGLGSCLVIAAACAGGDTPPRDEELEKTIRDTFDPGYAMGAAGSVGMSGAGGGSGTGGSTAGGTGGGASGSGGSTVASGGSDTAGSGTSGAGATGDICDAPTQVLRYGCGLGSGCHGDGALAARGDFGASEDQARALVDVTTQNGCGKYIDSANPGQSQILLKASGKQAAACGGDMPPNSNGLPQDDLDCLTSWLSQF